MKSDILKSLKPYTSSGVKSDSLDPKDTEILEETYKDMDPIGTAVEGIMKGLGQAGQKMMTLNNKELLTKLMEDYNPADLFQGFRQIKLKINEMLDFLENVAQQESGSSLEVQSESEPTKRFKYKGWTVKPGKGELKGQWLLYLPGEPTSDSHGTPEWEAASVKEAKEFIDGY